MYSLEKVLTVMILYLVSAVAKIELRGMAAALDNDLLEWAKFTPSGVPNDGKRAEERKQSRIFPRNFSASILKKKSYARCKFMPNHFYDLRRLGAVVTFASNTPFTWYQIRTDENQFVQRNRNRILPLRFSIYTRPVSHFFCHVNTCAAIFAHIHRNLRAKNGSSILDGNTV